MDLIRFLYFSFSPKRDRLNSDINYAHKCKTKKSTRKISNNSRNGNHNNKNNDDDDDDDKIDRLLKSVDNVPPVLDFTELKRNHQIIEGRANSTIYAKIIIRHAIRNCLQLKILLRAGRFLVGKEVEE